MMGFEIFDNSVQSISTTKHDTSILDCRYKKRGEKKRLGKPRLSGILHEGFRKDIGTKEFFFKLDWVVVLCCGFCVLTIKRLQHVC